VNGSRAVVILVTRFQHLAPEEIAGAVLLVVVLAVALLRPGPISQLFESPYSTPAPGGGPARQIVPDPTASPASGVPGERVIGVGLPTVVDARRTTTRP
jgi:hypothetical protein